MDSGTGSHQKILPGLVGLDDRVVLDGVRLPLLRHGGIRGQTELRHETWRRKKTLQMRDRRSNMAEWSTPAAFVKGGEQNVLLGGRTAWWVKALKYHCLDGATMLLLVATVEQRRNRRWNFSLQPTVEQRPRRRLPMHRDVDHAAWRVEIMLPVSHQGKLSHHRPLDTSHPIPKTPNHPNANDETKLRARNHFRHKQN